MSKPNKNIAVAFIIVITLFIIVFTILAWGIEPDNRVCLEGHTTSGGGKGYSSDFVCDRYEESK